MAENQGPGWTKIWHYIGDVFEWLQDWPHVSGVQRVALQLMAAGCGLDAFSRHDGVCVLAPSKQWLAPIAAADALAEFAPWTAPDAVSGLTGSRPDPASLLWPRTDEHVLFAGLVWTPRYVELFRRLHAFGIPFSVLVHDIIPLQCPDFVAADEPARFADWLRTALLTANTVLVSTRATGDAVGAWSRRAGVVPKAAIRTVPFGAPHLAALNLAGLRRPAAIADDPAGFVLSVGTIDRRKNQAMLVDIWERLERERAHVALPVLVLAGRPNLPGFAARVRALQATRKLVILDRASDAELAWAYRNCRFTVFPSLAEGYGLPVAESLAFGKPCIASDLPAIAESGGTDVRMCPAGDAAAWTAAIGNAIEHPPPPLSKRFMPSWADSLAAIRSLMADAETGLPGKKMGGS